MKARGVKNPKTAGHKKNLQQNLKQLKGAAGSALQPRSRSFCPALLSRLLETCKRLLALEYEM